MGTTLKRLVIPVTASIGIHVAAAAVFLYTMPPTEPPKPFETIQVTLVNEDAMRKGVSQIFESDIFTRGEVQANSKIVNTKHELPVTPIDNREDSTKASISYETTKKPTRRQFARTINPATNYALSNESTASNLHNFDLLEQLPDASDIESQDNPEPSTNQSEQFAAAVSETEQPTIQGIESSLADAPTVALDVAEIAASTKSVSDHRASLETAVEPISKSAENIELTEEYLNDENEIRLALVELADVAAAKPQNTKYVRDELNIVRNNTELTSPRIENRSPTALVKKTEVTTETVKIPDKTLSAPVELPKKEGFAPESETSEPIQLARSHLELLTSDIVNETITKEKTVETPIEQATDPYQLNTNATTNLAALENSKFDSGSEYLEPAFGLKGLHNPAPRYPYLSRVNNEEGRVILLVHVARDGTVTNVDTHESSGHRRLDRAAMKTIKKWTFKPANMAGVPVAGSVHVPVKFVLND